MAGKVLKSEHPGHSNSKVQFESELNYASGDAADSSADLAEVLRLDVPVDRLRIGVEVIEQVVDLGPEFRPEPFINGERFVHREVEVEQARKPDGVRPRRGAETSGGWLGECICVEP